MGREFDLLHLDGGDCVCYDSLVGLGEAVSFSIEDVKRRLAFGYHDTLGFSALQCATADLRAALAEIEQLQDTCDIGIRLHKAALHRAEQGEARAAALEREVTELQKQLAITSLAVPLEADLSARIDDALKHLAAHDGFSERGVSKVAVARLLIDIQRRMADDWARIGSEMRQSKANKSTTERLTEALRSIADGAGNQMCYTEIRQFAAAALADNTK